MIFLGQFYLFLVDSYLLKGFVLDDWILLRFSIWIDIQLWSLHMISFLRIRKFSLFLKIQGFFIPLTFFIEYFNLRNLYLLIKLYDIIDIFWKDIEIVPFDDNDWPYDKDKIGNHRISQTSNMIVQPISYDI